MDLVGALRIAFPRLQVGVKFLKCDVMDILFRDTPHYCRVYSQIPTHGRRLECNLVTCPWGSPSSCLYISWT